MLFLIHELEIVFVVLLKPLDIFWGTPILKASTSTTTKESHHNG